MGLRWGCWVVEYADGVDVRSVERNLGALVLAFGYSTGDTVPEK